MVSYGIFEKAIFFKFQYFNRVIFKKVFDLKFDFVMLHDTTGNIYVGSNFFTRILRITASSKNNFSCPLCSQILVHFLQTLPSPRPYTFVHFLE